MLMFVFLLKRVVPGYLGPRILFAFPRPPITILQFLPSVSFGNNEPILYSILGRNVGSYACRTVIEKLR